MNNTFKNQHVLITGGSSGIGAELVRRLSAAGASVTNWDIQPPTSSAPGVAWHDVDCTDYAAIDSAAGNLTTVHAVIHCAGVLHTGALTEVAPHLLARMVHVNLLGTVNIAHALLPHLQKTGGSLVLLASVSAFAGAPEFGTYAATKAAVYSLAQTLRLEQTGRGVHIGVVVPNFVDTPMLNAENRARGTLTRSRSMFLKIGTVEMVAGGILRGIERRQFLIYTHWRSRLVYLMSRYAAWSSHVLTLHTWRQAQKR